MYLSKTSQLLLLREMIDICFDILTKYKNQLCSNAHDVWVCKPGKTWSKTSDFVEWSQSATTERSFRIKNSKIWKTDFLLIHLKQGVDEPFYGVDLYMHVFLTTATDEDMLINTTPDTYLLATRNADMYRIWGTVWEWEWRDWTKEGSTSYLWATKGVPETVARSS